MSNQVKLISKSEYAKSRGIVPSAVTKAIKSGRITLIDGKIDPDVADIQWTRNTNPSQRRSNPALFSSVPGAAHQPADVNDQNPDGAVYNIAAARAKREHFDAQMSEMKALKESRCMVDSAAVAMALTSAGAQLRTALESIPDKLASRLAVESDHSTVHELLAAELNLALQAVATGFADLIANRIQSGDQHG